MPVRALAVTRSRKCSNRLFRQSRKAWEWVCPLRAQLLKLTTGSYGRRAKSAGARFFVSDFRSHDSDTELLRPLCLAKAHPKYPNRGQMHADAPRWLGPLRARREWPYGSAASQRYELPASHSITSSARASKVG